MSGECIFCKIIKGEIPSEKVYEDEQIVAFRDVNPQSPTHILIVPRKHIGRIADLQPEDALLMGQLMIAAQSVARHERVHEGFRLVINNGASAGQTVFHIHVHLLSGRNMGWPPG